MKRIGSQTREALEESGYTLQWGNGDTALLESEDGKLELWSKNDHHAGYVIEIDGYGYEFVNTRRSRND